MSGDDLQARLKALTPEQIRRLMAKRRGGEAAPPEPATPMDDEDLPVSLGQERFWFLSRLYPDTSDYNIPLAVLVDGDGVDAAALQRNLDAVIAAHEIFRTSFHERDGDVVQRIHATLPLAVEHEDRRAEYAADGDALVERLALAHGRRRFAVERLPLLAVTLVRLAERRHLLLLNIHHLISDGWSNSLLSQSLTAAPGTPPPRPQRQYRDFVAHERAWLASEECRTQLAFWRELLHDAPSPPAFRARSGGEAANAGGLVTLDLPDALCARIAAACSAQGRTQFQYYASCFALLLTRYANVDDIVIGTPVANRGRPEFMRTCGLFINTLPLRFRIDPARPFAAALADGAALIEACLARQELPYAELVKHVQVRRTLDENPLFNVQFAFQYFPHQKASGDFRLLSFDHGVGKFDLGGYVEISGAGNRLSLGYRRRAFDRADVERLAADFVHVLEVGLAPSPRALLDDEFLPPSSLACLRGPCVPRPGGNAFALFEQMANRHPQRSACADALGRIDYATLAAQVARVAAALAARGVRAGDRVLLRAPRDRHYAIGLLACLRLGAAYLPIAQDAPPALLQTLEREVGARLVLGSPAIGALPRLAFDEALADTAPAPDVAAVADDAIAYVVYTSGSTGAPKGVEVTHAGLVNYTLSLLERLDDPSLASYAHLSALDADLGNTAIFPALASGAALLLPDAAALLDAGRLAAFFAQHPADVAKAVPSHLRALRAGLRGVLPRRVLVCGGEALDADLVAAIRADAPDLRIVNHYGPAETTIGVLMGEVEADARDPLPLGTPLANTTIGVLDRHGRPVPRGTVGEIGIAGAGVARGYLGQPAVTAQRFVATRLDDGGRLYRSGDRGELGDRGFVFLGRDDHRVKVGGIMVQPEAIAALLQQHEAVAAAHAWADLDADGNARLTAAAVVREPIETGVLRAFLLRHLRAAQCPVLVLLPSLPLNANGKVDAHALRRLCDGQGGVASSGLPRDAVELALQRLFGHALGLAVAPCDVSFFDLGGSSLQAIALIARINETFSLHLPIAVLFEAGSVRALAEIVRSSGEHAAASPLVVLDDAAQDDLVVWIHPAGGNALCYVPVARQLASQRASIAFMAFGDDGGADIGALARDYHRRLGPYYATRRVVLAGWSMGALIAHEMAALAADEGRAVPLLLLDQPVPDADAPAQDFDTRVEHYLRKVEVFTAQRIRRPPRNDPAALLREFQRLDLVPPDTPVAAFAAFLGLLVHHNEIIAAFRPRRVSAPALLLRAAEPLAAQASAAADFGWQRHCEHLDVVQADGNHMTMLAASNAASLARAIDAWLARPG